MISSFGFRAPFGHPGHDLGTTSPFGPCVGIRVSRSGAQFEILRRGEKGDKKADIIIERLETPKMATNYQDRLRIPLQGNDYTRFQTSTGLHVATGYTRVVIGGRGPYIEFLPGHLVWDGLQIPEEEKYRTEHRWKDKVFYVEWRTKDQSNVKVYEQSKTVDYAD